jgi:hypothetical protein
MFRAPTLRLGLAVLIALAALRAEPARAQVLEAAERAELEARLAEIDARFEALERAVDAREARIRRKIEADASRIERVEVGPFVIEGPRAEVEEVAEGVLGAWLRYEPIFGRDTTLPTFTIQVVRSADLASVVEGSATTRRLAFLPGRRNASAGSAIAQQMFQENLPRMLNAWTANQGWDRLQARRIGYQALLQSPHPLSLACSQEGDVRACMDFLFVDYDGSPQSVVSELRGWYPEPVELWTRITREARGAALDDAGCNAPELPWYDPNGPESDFERCARRAARIYGAALAPSKPVVRGSLLRFALERAEVVSLGALDTLPEDASIGDQLEVISGVPTERLVAEWLDALTLVDSGPAGQQETSMPVSLLWAGAFTLLALRSTRWRLG